MKEVIEFLKKCGIFFLATVEDKSPRVRPFGAINEYNGKLYFITSNTKDVYKQLVKNNQVEICASTPDSWLRLSGSVKFDDSRDAKKAMLDSNPGLRRMYSEDDDKMVVFYLENATGKIFSFVKPMEEYKF